MSKSPVGRSVPRITRGALILLCAGVAVSLLRAMSDEATRASIDHWLAASPDALWRRGRVWTVITSPLLEPRFLSLLFQAFLLWSFMPTLERFWGTGRVLRFAAMTSVAGVLGGTLMGLATGREVPIFGLDPFVYAGIVAFGVIYARQPVQFFGVLPMTGRQLMFGILGFLVLFITLNGAWEEGVSFAAAIGLAAMLTSRRWNPELLLGRWRRARARAHLKVVPPEPEAGSGKRRGGRGDSQWLN